MKVSIPVINIDSSEEDNQFTSLLGGKEGCGVPMEVVVTDCEQDRIDEVMFKASDFNEKELLEGKTIWFKNKIKICSFFNGNPMVMIDQGQLKAIVDEMLDSYDKIIDFDWTFYDCSIDLLKEFYYQFRMFHHLYDWLQGHPLINDLFSSKQYDLAFKHVYAFRKDGEYHNSLLRLDDYTNAKEYVRSKVPKYNKRYESGKRKGQAYWKYGWNELIGISIDFAVSSLASDKDRFAITYAKDFFDDALLVGCNELVVKFVKELSDPASEWYFPFWCKIRLMGYWYVTRDLDCVHFENVKVIFLGVMQNFQGGSSEEIV